MTLRSTRTLAALTLAAITTLASHALADVRLPHVFSDNMVLQQQMPLPVWGWDDPGQKVTVSIAGEEQTATTDADGHWKLSLPAMKADGKKYELTVKGSSTATFSNVVLGEVWLCSGQSNMEMGLANTLNGAAEIAAADHPNIRLLLIPKVTAGLPQDDVKAHWVPCTPKSIRVGDFGGFSAAGYYFGRKLNETLNVPVGLIDSSWGGTLIEPWMPAASFHTSPRFRFQAAEVDAEAKKMMEAGGADPVAASVGKLGSGGSTSLYNAMIHPLVPFAIKGALWYQGEANLQFLGDGSNYTAKQKALIQGWRDVWNQPDMPFYYVQLAPMHNTSPGYLELPAFWEAQANVQSIPHTGMVITRDITTDLADIHPKNKKDVGLRLAALALHNTYGKTDVVANGPTFKSLRIDGDKAIVTFDHTNGGLTTKDGKAPDWFTIAGEDGNFVKADAAITGPSEITVSSPSVKTPVAVRFAWDQIATPNLHNGAGFPADAFRTDHTVLKSLALNKPVTASHDAQADFVPENIVDGDADNSSSWRCPTSPAWIQVDLGDVHQIDEVKVFPYYDGQRHYQYTVETSTDGKTWNEVVDMTNATAPETAAGHDHHLDATPARYVRVNMIKNSANPAVHLNELLVFGK